MRQLSKISFYLQKISANRVIGLDNPAYVCYFNAIVQILLGIKEFCVYLYTREYLRISYATHFKGKPYCQAFAKLITELWTLEEEYDFLKPAFFHRLIEKKFNPTM